MHSNTMSDLELIRSLSYTDVRLLRKLYEYERQGVVTSLRQLARDIGVVPSMVWRSVQKLRQLGLVTEDKHIRIGTAVALKLTDRGRELVEKYLLHE